MDDWQQPSANGAPHVRIPDGIQALHEQMTEWRRTLHAYPELGFEETRTSDFIADKLESFGLEVSRGLAKTGVVGTLRHGDSSRAIGLRADIDALPMEEKNNFDHRSQNPGCMHACGHDGHTTMLLGAAAYLAENPQFDGRVHFIFQPAEESFGGGEVMVREGLFEQFPVDAVYGMHNWPGLELAHFGVRSGPAMASSDTFELTVTGKGGHAAMPQLGRDPFIATSQLLAGLQALPSRRFAATDSLVISVTQVHGGSAWNVIPDDVVIRGTVRSLRTEVRDAVKPMMQELAEGIATATQTQCTLNYQPGYPVTVNHNEQTETAAKAASEVAGIDCVDRGMPPSMGAEDFAYMLEARPGAYVWLGNGNDSLPLHSASYDFNDAILPTGAAYWTRLAHGILKNH